MALKSRILNVITMTRAKPQAILDEFTTLDFTKCFKRCVIAGLTVDSPKETTLKAATLITR
jgi:hypothetical protein